MRLSTKCSTNCYLNPYLLEFILERSTFYTRMICLINCLTSSIDIVYKYTCLIKNMFPPLLKNLPIYYNKMLPIQGVESIYVEICPVCLFSRELIWLQESHHVCPVEKEHIFTDNNS